MAGGGDIRLGFGRPMKDTDGMDAEKHRSLEVRTGNSVVDVGKK